MDSALLVFTVGLTLAFMLSELFYRLRYPKVIGQILAGVILGLPIFAVWIRQDSVYGLISSLADLGVVFLMLLVGTEINIKQLKTASKKAATLALLGYITPLTMGFVAMYLMGYETLTALIVGICLAISAEAITLEILMENKMLNTPLGTTIMEAGMIDDLLGVLSLTVVIAVVKGAGFSELRYMPGEFLTFILLAYILGFTILPKAAKVIWKEKSEPAVFSLAIIFGLIIVMLSNMFHLSSVIGAFIAGVIIQLSIKNKREEKEIVESLNIVTFGLVIPFFFIYTGINFDIQKLIETPFLIITLTVIALAGKLLAANIVGSLYKLGNHERMLIGWGMNSRGAVELVIATIALSEGLIDENIFSAVVAMAVLSSLISPIMFRSHCVGKMCFVNDQKKDHHHLTEK